MHSYEIQTFKDGEWKVASIFDDREQAIDEARRIEQSTRYAGVKVIEEYWDEATNTSTYRTLFRGGAAKNDLPAKTKADGESEKSGHRTGKGTERPGQRKQQAKKAGFVVPILVLIAILLAAGAVLTGLQHLFGLQ